MKLLTLVALLTLTACAHSTPAPQPNPFAQGSSIGAVECSATTSTVNGATSTEIICGGNQ